MAREVLEIAENASAAANACAAWILEELRAVLASAPVARIAFSGGTTPRLMLGTLARTPFPWSRVHIYWVDERCVPPTDSQSNFRLVSESFFQHAAVPAENIHRVYGELDPAQAADRYVQDIRAGFSLGEGELPVFDIIHRGMGPDAHTASLFPGEPLIADRTGLAAAVYVQKLNMHRVTLLPGVLLAARRTAILATGEDKADALLQVLRGPDDPSQFPCQLGTRGALNALWFIDRAASARL